MKINPLVFKKKEQLLKDVYEASCCAAHRDNIIDLLGECDHTHPWED